MFQYFQRMVWLPSWSDLVRGSGQPQRSLGSFWEDQEGVSGASFLEVEEAVAHLEEGVLWPFHRASWEALEVASQGVGV